MIPEARYIFKHALVQDAAYDSLLKSRRQELHGKIARVLEARFPEVKDTEPELLAHHYAAAGQAGAAIAYWLKAAKRAASRSTYRESLAHLDAGTAMLSGLPPGSERTRLELQLQLQRSTALLATQGMSAAATGKAFAAARELCNQLGEDTKEIFQALYGIWAFHVASSQFQGSHEVAQEALRRAQQINEPAVLVLAHRMMGTTLVPNGALPEAAEHLEKVGLLYDPERDRESALIYGSDIKAGAFAWLSQAKYLLGQPDRALAVASAALEHAESLKHFHSIAFARYWLPFVHLQRREPEQALEEGKLAMSLSEKHGFGMWYQLAKASCGVALIELGQTSDGMVMIRESLTEGERMGIRFNSPYHLAALGIAAAKAQQWEEAANYLTEAANQVEISGQRWYEGEIYRLRGELLLAQGAEEAQAESSLVRSLEIVRAQHARSWELRTSTSLAKLWQSQGKRQEAHDLLAPLYNWFIEGLDTKDLKEAKALLEELAS